MKIIKSVKYKKAMKNLSYKEIFDEALQMNNGDSKAAAEAVLDIATGGTWAVWDQEKINKSIQNVLDQLYKSPITYNLKDSL